MGCGHACHIKERKHSQCQGNVDFHFSRRESPFPAKEVERDFHSFGYLNSLHSSATKWGYLGILKDYSHPNARYFFSTGIM